MVNFSLKPLCSGLGKPYLWSSINIITFARWHQMYRLQYHKNAGLHSFPKISDSKITFGSSINIITFARWHQMYRLQYHKIARLHNFPKISNFKITFGGKCICFADRQMRRPAAHVEAQKGEICGRSTTPWKLHSTGVRHVARKYELCT